VLAKTNHLIILSNDLRCALGKVESERCLISAEVVDVEDQLLRKILRVSPDNPPYTWVYKTILWQISNVAERSCPPFPVPCALRR
jgi:hypothetical protein